MKFCKSPDLNKEVQLFTEAVQLPDIWDEGLSEDHFLRRASLNLSSNASLEHIAVCYALLVVNGQKIAQAHFHLLRLHESHFSKEALSGWKQLGWKLVQTLVNPTVLVSGHLFRHDVQSYVDFVTDGYERYMVYQQLLEAAQEHTRPDAVVLKDIPVYTTKYFYHFAPQYFLLRNDISMEMELPVAWKTFADYERAIKHKYAQRARKVRKAFAPVTIQEFSVEELRSQLDEVYELYKQVAEKQTATLGILSKEYLMELKEKHEKELKFWGFFYKDELIAFASAWVKEEAFDMFYIGFDYSKNQELQVYFNLLFFSLEQAILHGCKQVILGRTALEAKARLGCKPKYLNTMLYIRNPILRRLVARTQQQLHAAEGEWEQRHPLK